VFVYFGPLALLPLITDVLLTLLWRARRGRPLLQAHRDHLYQLWLQRTGRPHWQLAWRVWLIVALAAALALIAQDLPAALQPLVFAAAVGVMAAAWYAVRRRLSRPT
jgi:UDP-N-acetylmuramyl pentapeptide phosphotransferase/UDP-N-acetylglucosamine-1-phosphate transferase